MTGTKKIVEHIQAEAQTEIDAVLAEARAKAEATAAEFAKKAQAEADELLRAGTDAAEQRVARQERTNRLEARKDILGLKQDLVSAAFDKARRAILDMDGDKYVAFMAKLAGEAALTGSEEIVLGKGDAQRLGDKIVAAANAAAAGRGLPGEMKLASAALPADGGLVLRRGSIEVNCTLDKLLEMSHSSLDAEVASVLFN